MAIGVILALMGHGVPYPIGQHPVDQWQNHGAGRGAKPHDYRDFEGTARQNHGHERLDSRAKRGTIHINSAIRGGAGLHANNLHQTDRRQLPPDRRQTGRCHRSRGRGQATRPVLGMDATELGAMLSGTGQYAVLKKDVTPAVKRKISKLNLGGIVLCGTQQRTHLFQRNPDGRTAGRRRWRRQCVAGIEHMENKTLTAEADTRSTNKATTASKSQEP